MFHSAWLTLELTCAALVVAFAFGAVFEPTAKHFSPEFRNVAIRYGLVPLLGLVLNHFAALWVPRTIPYEAVRECLSAIDRNDTTATETSCEPILETLERSLTDPTVEEP